MNTHDFDFERDGHVGVITFNNPSRMNPLGEALQRALLEFLPTLGQNDDIHMLVITGAGRRFCVGADLASVAFGEDAPKARDWPNPDGLLQHPDMTWAFRGS